VTSHIPQGILGTVYDETAGGMNSFERMFGLYIVSGILAIPQCDSRCLCADVLGSVGSLIQIPYSTRCEARSRIFV
jgi:hypothetical protein